MFAVPEKGLAVSLEDFGDGHACRRFNGSVGVDEIQSEPLRKAAPDRGLAGSHNADKDDGTAAKAPHEAGRARVAPLRQGACALDRALGGEGGCAVHVFLLA